MKTYLVEKEDRVSWCMDYAMVVIANDALHAEKLARITSHDFRKAKISVTEIDQNKELVVLIANSGA